MSGLHLVSDAVPDPPRLPRTTDDTQSPGSLSTIVRNLGSRFDVALRTFLSSNSLQKQSNQRNENQFRNESRKQYNNYNSSPGYTSAPIFYNNVQNSTGVTLNQKVVNYSPPRQPYHQNADIKEEQRQRIALYIPDLIKNSASITTEDKLKIKTLVSEWKKVAKNLGFKKNEAKQHFKNYKHEGIEEVFYKLIISWEQRQGRLATVGKLFEALWLSREYDCIEQLAENYGYRLTSQ